jgi:hypothetical protein
MEIAPLTIIMTLAADPPLLILVFFGIVILPSKYKTAVPVPEKDITLSSANPQSVYSKLPPVNEVELKLPVGFNTGKGVTNEKVGIGLQELLLHEFPLEITVPPLAEREWELENTSEHCVASTLNSPEIKNKNAVKLRNSIGKDPSDQDKYLQYTILLRLSINVHN